MTSAKRIVSGSLASWSKILVTATTQIALVPVFLSHWSVNQYGCWLVIQALVAFTGTVTQAFHAFLGHEFMRVPGRDASVLSGMLSSALPFSLLLGLVELGVLAGLIMVGYAVTMLDASGQFDARLQHEAIVALLALAGANWLCNGSTGLYGRMAGNFGHFPRTAWWGVGLAMANALISALLVLSGFQLMATAIGVVVFNLAFAVAFQLDLWRVVKTHGVVLQRPDWNEGWRSLVASLPLGLTYLLQQTRQQGARVLVSSTLGVASTVAFSTMRTASNVALQGMSTVMDPMFPEFMGFLRDRNRNGVIGSFALLWLAVVFAIGPLLVLLQALAPVLFEVWTQGKVPFDPVVFALFSITLLVFAVARPANAIVVGNNLLGLQLTMALGITAVVVGGIVWLAQLWGVRGAAGAFLLAELLATVVVTVKGRQWLQVNGLDWPDALFGVTLWETALCCMGLLLVALMPDHAATIVLLVLLGSACLTRAFYLQLPLQQRQWLASRLSRFTPRLGM